MQKLNLTGMTMTICVKFEFSSKYNLDAHRIDYDIIRNICQNSIEIVLDLIHLVIEFKKVMKCQCVESGYLI